MYAGVAQSKAEDSGACKFKEAPKSCQSVLVRVKEKGKGEGFPFVGIGCIYIKLQIEQDLLHLPDYSFCLVVYVCCKNTENTMLWKSYAFLLG